MGSISFTSLNGVRMFTPDLDAAVAFYERLGLRVAWRGTLPDAGAVAALVFPDGSGTLTLQDDARAQFTDVELRVPDVDAAYAALSLNPEVRWLRPPFDTPFGRASVLRAPDGNVLTLVSGPAPAAG